MKQHPSRPGRRHMHGLSLIELMVSLTIGLILMVAIVSAYLGSAGASRMAEAQGRMNEDAQAALAILTQQLRMAGNNPRQPNYANAQPKNPVFPAGTYFVRGCDGAFSDITTAADIASLHCSAGSNTQPDSIAVSYEADRFNTVPTTGGAATDCLGQSLPVVSTSTLAWDGSATVATPVTYTVADNRYYIGTSTVITSPSLYCKGNNANSSPQPLVENVEDMQFLYGTAPASGTMTVAGYLRADEVTALAAPVDDPARWARTITVRICVLIRSELPVVADAASARYLPCFETNRNNTVAAPDLRLRRAYITTVVLRNRLAAP